MDDAQIPSRTTGALSRILRTGAWTAAVTLVAGLVLVGIATQALPWSDDDPRWAARWLGETLHRDVRLDGLEFTVERAVPVLRLRGVRIGAPPGSGSAGLALERVQVEISALQSIRHARLHPRRISIVGADISLRRDAGGLTLDGLGQQQRPAGDALGAVVAALPEDCEFTLEQARLSVRAATPGRGARRMVLSPVSLHLARSDGEVRLALQLSTAGQGRLRAQAGWRAGDDPLEAMSLAVNTSRLPLQRIAEAVAVTLPRELQGTTDLDLVAQLHGGQLSSARGSVQLNGLRHGTQGAAAASQPAARVTSLFDLARVQQSWQLNLLRVSLHDGGDEGGSRGSARIRSPAWDTGPYHLHLDALALTDLRILGASFAPALGRRLDTAFRQGRLEDIEVMVPAPDAPLSAVELEATFKDVTLRETLMPAALTPASGKLSLRGSAGTLRLQPVNLTLPPRPDGPGRRLSAEGVVAFSLDRDGLSLRAQTLDVFDARTRAELNGTLRIGHGDEGVVSDLSGRIDHLTGQALIDYLGSAISNHKLDAWLRRSLPAGDARDVTFTVLGTSRSLTEFVRGMRVRGRFEGLQLDYAAGWPSLTDLRGQLWLEWPALGFQVDAGRVSGNSIEQASARIEDVTDGDSGVRVDGRIVGLTQDGARFLLESPLKSRFEGLLSHLNARGAAELELGLDIPFSPGAPAIEGSLILQGNTIAVPSLRSDLQQVRGRIQFSEAGLLEGALAASYLGRPIEASLAGARAGGLFTALRIRGRTTPSGLIQHLFDIGVLDSPRADNLPLLQRLAGETAWAVDLDIPSARNPDPSLGLGVRSDLAGMSLDLPAPLGKTGAETRSLEVRTRIGGDPRRVFEIAYGTLARARLEVRARDGGYEFTRGGVRFGGKAASLPGEQGLKVAGQLQLLSVDDWLGLIAQAGGGLASRGASLGAINQVEVRAAKLNALGIGFDDVRLQLRRPGPEAVQLSLDAPRVKGLIRIPVPLSGRSITGHFQRVHATEREPAAPGPRGAARPILDVATFPALDARIDDLRYGDLELGEALLSLRPRDGAIEIERLTLTNPAFAVTGGGSWFRRDGRTLTELSLRLQGDDLGKTLNAFGYDDNGVKGAPVDVRLEGRWEGSPLAFSLSRMTGQLELLAGKGRFIGVEPGTTRRVFGLLSVTLLPRRLLRLDFSDLFGEGIGFRRIRGRFDVDRGNAYTSNLTLDADTAQVDIAGRVGLADRDYDQVMTVAPKLSSSLPLAPLWLAEQVLDRKLLDPAFAYRYTITGSWDSPRVERIRRPPQEQARPPASAR